MVTKIRDLAVKTGSYTDNVGNEKGRWTNIGSLMKGDDGGEFLILHRHFNPAGVPNPESRDSVIISCFPVKDNGGQPQQSAPADYDDMIPF